MQYFDELLCNTGRASDSFVVFGRVLRSCFSLNVVTFNYLVKAVFVEDGIQETTKLLTKLIAFGCKPDVVTYTTRIKGLCGTGNAVHAIN